MDSQIPSTITDVGCFYIVSGSFVGQTCKLILHTNSCKIIIQMVRQSTIMMVKDQNYHDSEYYHDNRSALAGSKIAQFKG